MPPPPLLRDIAFRFSLPPAAADTHGMLIRHVSSRQDAAAMPLFIDDAIIYTC